jgi:hypothetical protein
MYGSRNTITSKKNPSGSVCKEGFNSSVKALKRKYIKVYRRSEREFGGKLNSIDNFNVDYIHRFGLDTFVSFENEERTVLLTPRKNSNNNGNEA